MCEYVTGDSQYPLTTRSNLSEERVELTTFYKDGPLFTGDAH